jgi:hypothetical protein
MMRPLFTGFLGRIRSNAKSSSKGSSKGFASLGMEPTGPRPTSDDYSYPLAASHHTSVMRNQESLSEARDDIERGDPMSGEIRVDRDWAVDHTGR